MLYIYCNADIGSGIYVRRKGMSKCPYCGGSAEKISWDTSKCRSCGETYNHVRMGSSDPNKNCRECGRPFWVPDPFRIGTIIPDYPNTSDLCDRCSRRAWEKYEKEREKKYKRVKKPCGTCDGTGKIKGYKCVSCDGKGYNWSEAPR